MKLLAEILKAYPLPWTAARSPTSTMWIVTAANGALVCTITSRALEVQLAALFVMAPNVMRQAQFTIEGAPTGRPSGLGGLVRALQVASYPQLLELELPADGDIPP